MAEITYTDEEILAAIGPKQRMSDKIMSAAGNSASNFADQGIRLLKGMNRGAVGLMTLPAEVASLPYNLYQSATGGETFSPYQRISEVLGISKPKQGDVAGTFGEGAVGGLGYGPSAAMVGGLTNIAVKGLSPDSPMGQLGISLVLPTAASIVATRRANVQQGYKPSEGETGATLTKGQATGGEKALHNEAEISGIVQGRPAFKALESAQSAHLKDYADKIQQFTNRKDLSATEIRSGVVGEMNKASDAVLNKFRATNRVNFDAARVSAGDARLFSTDNVIAAIDKKIALYSEPTMPPELQAIASGLKELKDNFITPAIPSKTVSSTIVDSSGKPVSTTVIPEVAQINKKLTIDELQKHLESLANAAKTGSYSTPGAKTNSFSGATPGTIKGIVRDILKGFKEDLDAANLDGIPGSAELIKARDSFRNGIKTMNDFASQPLVKKLNLESENSITPEATVKGLLQAPPTERKAILALVETAKPEIYQSLRHRAMQELLNKSNSAEGLATTMANVRKQVLNERIGNTSDGIPFDDFLFPTAGEKAKFLKLTNDLELIARKSSSNNSMNINPMNPASDISSVAGGSIARYATRAAIDVWRIITAQSPEKISIAMTSPNAATTIAQLARYKALQPIPKDLIDKLAPFTQLEKNLSVGGLSSAAQSRKQEPGAALNRPREQSQDYTDEEIMKALQQ